MRSLTLVALSLFLVSQHPIPTPAEVKEPEQQQSSTTQKSAANDQQGTEQLPLVVKILPSMKTQAEADQDAKDREDKTANERRSLYLTGFLALTAFLQLLVYGFQSYFLKQTVESAGEQSKAMDRHIGEAARSATAMEDIADKIQAGNKAILRAYLTVVVGEAIFQERREGQGDLKFEARPNLLNTGNTPARKVHIQIAADVLPVPIPEDFGYPLPEVGPDAKDAGTVGSHQTYTMAATVKNFVPDGEVTSIKEGTGKVLCVWGRLTYEDIFGEAHFTNFAQSITWFPDNKVFGYYTMGRNDSD